MKLIKVGYLIVRWKEDTFSYNLSYYTAFHPRRPAVISHTYFAEGYFP